MKGQIKTAPALAGLKDFDPISAYPAYDGMPELTPDGKQHEMGHISNLITDMTIKGAGPDELARAVRHSMVVIDAEKHNLNYRQSAIDNGIRQLRERYQSGPRGAASTLISRANSDLRVPDRNPRRASDGGPIDPVTGEKVFTETGKTYRNKAGDVVAKTITVPKLGETSDAHTLSSGTRIETVYADHANKMKALANTARLESLKQPPITRSKSAAKVYATEVSALAAELALQVYNRPLERQAQIFANAVAKSKRAERPDMDDDAKKKVAFQALREARIRTGAAAHKIEITPRQWEAIQAGAISNTMLNDLLTKADLDIVKQLATPRTTKRVMTSAKLARAQQMLASGYTRAEVARALGVALGTLDEAIYPENG
jgi:transposase-like protein